MRESRIEQGDCVAKLAELEPGSVDLVFADPPFNIGYKYDVYDDRKGYDQYLDWSRKWMRGVVRALSPTGTFWLAIGDEYAAELKLIAQNDLGLTCRSWVIWYYTFGVNCTKKFNRSHAHLFHFVKDGRIGKFTFNAQDPDVRVPSARQLVYADGRANPDGRLPDDTWILRPQDVPNGFSAEQDTWYYPRVAGTFKERAGFHGCQMPEQLLGRIIRISSDKDDLVLDPFGGSGTTLVVAKKLGRKYLGFELSRDYVTKIRGRLDSVREGQPLDGSAAPLHSAPPTSGTRTQRNGASQSASNGSNGVSVLQLRVLNGLHVNRRKHLTDCRDAILEAFERTRRGFSSDYVLAHPEINAAFIHACNKKGIAGTASDWNHFVMNLRKSGALPPTKVKHDAIRLRADVDRCGFASEIALHELTDDKQSSLDDVLCDPELAARFDRIAETFAPGFKPLQFRWAALTIRKRTKDIKKAAIELGDDLRQLQRGRWQMFREKARQSIDEMCALYVLRAENGKLLYVGETQNISYRLRLHEYSSEELRIEKVQVVPYNSSGERRRGLQALMVRNLSPLLNLRLLTA